MEPDEAKKAEFTALAEEWTKKAVELRKQQKAEAEKKQKEEMQKAMTKS
jgi:hypothetical protein